MLRKNRIELPQRELFPVQAFFNAISDRNFVEVIRDLLAGVGQGVGEAVCTFPTDLDPGEEIFEGVRFSLFEESVTISTELFGQVIVLACDAFVAEHPGQRLRIEELLRSRSWR